MYTHMSGEFHGASWELRSGRACRACGSPIGARDGFGLSEGICRACRGDAMGRSGQASVWFGGGARLALRAAAAVGEGASRSIAALRRAA
jgi:hypothetical protein